MFLSACRVNPFAVGQERPHRVLRGDELKAQFGGRLWMAGIKHRRAARRTVKTQRKKPHPPVQIPRLICKVLGFHREK